MAAERCALISDMCLRVRYLDKVIGNFTTNRLPNSVLFLHIVYCDNVYSHVQFSQSYAKLY